MIVEGFHFELIDSNISHNFSAASSVFSQISSPCAYNLKMYCELLGYTLYLFLAQIKQARAISRFEKLKINAGE